jgi:hypothetical protein
MGYGLYIYVYMYVYVERRGGREEERRLCGPCMWDERMGYAYSAGYGPCSP